MSEGQETLIELLEFDDKLGFIVMDGIGALFGTLSGNTREVLHQFTVNLGGQMEERHSYVRETAELATRFFINPVTSQTNVSGLILAAASAEIKTELSQFDVFDPRLEAKILYVVDVYYGGEDGFSQAIYLSPEIRANARFLQEQRLLRKYMEGMSRDAGKYVVGADHTVESLEMGAVEILIVWENLDINRYVLRNSTTGEIVVKHLDKYQEGDQGFFRDFDTNAELVVQEKMSLLEWLSNECIKYGCTLEFVTDKSLEGAQFCDLLGIGGILRYHLDIDDEGEIWDSDQHRGTR